MVVPLCCMCMQTLTHFPCLRAWDRQDQAFSLSLLLLTPLCPPMAQIFMFSLPLAPCCVQHPLTSCRSHFFNTWFPHSFWPCIPWRHKHVSDGICLMRGSIWAPSCLWALDNYVHYSGVWCILGSAFWQPDLGMLLLSLVEDVSSQAKLSPTMMGSQCWAPQRVFAFLKANIVGHILRGVTSRRSPCWRTGRE